jgi:hypothetical protein
MPIPVNMANVRKTYKASKFMRKAKALKIAPKMQIANVINRMGKRGVCTLAIFFQ